MKTTMMFLGVALVFFGCSKAEDDWPDYTARSGDLTAFTIESAIKLGARPRATNGLPVVRADWHYKAIGDRIQVVLAGNRFLELQSILTNAFGPLPQPPSSSPRSIGASLGPEAGVDIKYTWDRTPDDKEYTTLIIAKAQKASAALNDTNKPQAKPDSTP